MKSSKAKHLEEPVSIRRMDDDGDDDEQDTMLRDNGSDPASDMEREIKTEGVGEGRAPKTAIPSAVAAPAVLPASITDDLGGGGLGFGNEGTMGAFFRKRRR